ncbi:MAG: acetylornithine deacetylase [Acidobacteria bacterium]|nr:MAG: acetylornithine deacetylase [Acidobacteriota bacterium]
MAALQFKVDRTALLNLLADLISINSINPAFATGAPGEGKIGQYVSDFFKRHKIRCQRHEVLPGRFNVIGQVPGRDPNRCLIFDAHLDTVSVQGMSIDPFEPKIQDNNMFGRGSCDTKAGMAGMLMALQRVSQSDVRPPTNIWVTATIDEEHSFQGIRYLVNQGIRAAGAVIAEPTQLETIISHKGCVRWKISTQGRSAHSAKPQLGINAITQMARLIGAIETRIVPHYEKRKHPMLGSPTINIGVIQGGIQVNLVPDSCEIQIDRRTLPGESSLDVLTDFEELVRELEKEDANFKAVIETPVLEDSCLETLPHEKIVRVAEDAGWTVCGHSRLTGVPYATNASKLSALGIPSVVLGPGNIDQAHTAVEFVDIEQVAQAAEIYLGIMLGFDDL